MIDFAKCATCPACIKNECLGLALYAGKSGGRKPIWQVTECPKEKAGKA
jgi:hypothetical protein